VYTKNIENYTEARKNTRDWQITRLTAISQQASDYWFP